MQVSFDVSTNFFAATTRCFLREQDKRESLLDSNFLEDRIHDRYWQMTRERTTISSHFDSLVDCFLTLYKKQGSVPRNDMPYAEQNYRT